MTALSTSLQHWILNILEYSNFLPSKARKKELKIQGLRRKKFFIDYVVVNIENLREATEIIRIIKRI